MNEDILKLNVKDTDLPQFLNVLFNHNSYDYVVVYKCEGDGDVYSIEAHHIGETE